MKNETNNGITRRSFMKRSTVAAIAVTNLAIFGGIVNAHAETTSPSLECVKLGNCGLSGQLEKCAGQWQKNNVFERFCTIKCDANGKIISCS